MNVAIPRGDYDSVGPCWIPSMYVGKPIKPKIKCQCGKICNIGLHHVHADGIVTASFWDSEETSFVHNGVTYQHEAGCGWHVFLTLLDYSDGEFPPVP